MSDQTSDRNEKLKAAMRDRNTGNLNTSGKNGVVVALRTKAAVSNAALRVT
jgi:hypothetical protein